MDLRAKPFLQLQLATPWRNDVSFVNLNSRLELKKISFTFSHEEKNQSNFHCHTKSFALFQLGAPPGTHSTLQLKTLICPLLSCSKCIHHATSAWTCSCVRTHSTNHHHTNIEVRPEEGRNLGHRARQDLVHVVSPGTAGWECSCSVSEVFWTGCFTANKTCKVFREFGALGRMMHNHLMPQNRLAPVLDQKQLWMCTAWSPD